MNSVAHRILLALPENAVVAVRAASEGPAQGRQTPSADVVEIDP